MKIAANYCNYGVRTMLKIHSNQLGIFSSYEEYVRYQIERKKGQRFESEDELCKLTLNAFFNNYFLNIDRKVWILDCGCGDGLSLKILKSLDFENIEGIELNPLKVKYAKNHGLKIIQGDIHDLTSIFPKNSFDIVCATRVLEHAFAPDEVIKEIFNILKSKGLFYVALPYPEKAMHLEFRKRVHCGSKKLGLQIHDDGKTLIHHFTKCRFSLLSKTIPPEGKRREREVWLEFRKEL